MDLMIGFRIVVDTSMSRFVFLVLAVIFGQVAAKFPIDPKPCKFGDTSCIRDIINFLLSRKGEGYSPLNLVKYDPLHVASMNIKQGKQSPVNIDLRFRNTELAGLSDSIVTDVKGFGEDLTQQHEIHFKTPLLTMIGDYKISGRVLILPIQGVGGSNVTLVNTNLVVYFRGAPLVKPEGTYLQIKNVRLTLDPKRVYFNFGNLFNGDKLLGDNMNRFVNDNWQDIFREVQGSISDAYGQIFESVIGKVFEKYPYEKLFA